MKIFSLMLMAPAFVFFACSSANTSDNKHINTTATSLTGTYWKLTELNGKALQPADTTRRREIYMYLDTSNNRVSGNGGCNGFGGTFATKGDGFAVSFSQMIRTQMACEEISLENDFLKVLELTDSYYITGSGLQLNRARMAPLAKFVVVPEKNNILKNN